MRSTVKEDRSCCVFGNVFKNRTISTLPRCNNLDRFSNFTLFQFLLSEMYLFILTLRKEITVWDIRIKSVDCWNTINLRIVCGISGHGELSVIGISLHEGISTSLTIVHVEELFEKLFSENSTFRIAQETIVASWYSGLRFFDAEVDRWG